MEPHPREDRKEQAQTLKKAGDNEDGRPGLRYGMLWQEGAGGHRTQDTGGLWLEYLQPAEPDSCCSAAVWRNRWRWQRPHRRHCQSVLMELLL